MYLSASHKKSLNNYSFLDPLSTRYQILGLGEATHGNKEFHVVRAEISKYLIQHHGFQGVIMEFPYSNSDEINKYVLTGKGNLKKILLGLGYWTCATEEIMQFIVWIKEFNQNNPKAEITLMGNDVDITDPIRYKAGRFRDKKMADRTARIAGKSKYIVWSHNYHISKFIGEDFTSMGHYLAERVQYYNIATLFYKGFLTAMKYDSSISQWGKIAHFQIPQVENDSLEHYLHLNRESAFFTNIHELPLKTRLHFNKVKARFLGAGFDPNDTTSLFQEMNFSKMFDGFIFMKKVTPSVLLK